MPLAGIRIFCTEERSQGKNREKAMSLLRSKLFDIEQEKQRSEIAAKRKNQVRFNIGACVHPVDLDKRWEHRHCSFCVNGAAITDP